MGFFFPFWTRLQGFQGKEQDGNPVHPGAKCHHSPGHSSAVLLHLHLSEQPEILVPSGAEAAQARPGAERGDVHAQRLQTKGKPSVLLPHLQPGRKCFKQPSTEAFRGFPAWDLCDFCEGFLSSSSSVCWTKGGFLCVSVSGEIMEFLWDKARKPFLKHLQNTSFKWEGNAGKDVIQHFPRRAFHGCAQFICHLSLSSDHPGEDLFLGFSGFPIPSAKSRNVQNSLKALPAAQLLLLLFGFSTAPRPGRILKIILMEMWPTSCSFFLVGCAGLAVAPRAGLEVPPAIHRHRNALEEHFPVSHTMPRLLILPTQDILWFFKNLVGFAHLEFGGISFRVKTCISIPHTLGWWIYPHFPWKFPIPAFLYSLEWF